MTTSYICPVTEQGKVRNLEVSEETTNSFRVSWEPAPGSVVRYHLTYFPQNDAGNILQTQTAGPETTTVLTQLLPITTYRVSVSAEYSTGLGEQMQTTGITKECELVRSSFIWN